MTDIRHRLTNYMSVRARMMHKVGGNGPRYWSMKRELMEAIDRYYASEMTEAEAFYQEEMKQFKADYPELYNTRYVLLDGNLIKYVVRNGVLIRATE